MNTGEMKDLGPYTGPGWNHDWKQREHDEYLPGWLAVIPSAYLDARRPEWAEQEKQGLVRYHRVTGSKHALIYISPLAGDLFRQWQAALSIFAQEEKKSRAARAPR